LVWGADLHSRDDITSFATSVI